MGARSTQNDSPDFSAVFKAISDPTRIKILTRLNDSPTRVSDLVKMFKLSQSTISRHLGVLKVVGLVFAERKGKEVHYSLNPRRIVGCCCGFFKNFSCCEPYFVGAKRGRGRKKRGKGVGIRLSVECGEKEKR
ncbi:MAG: metalloregulator ArsR/SmtB family transcription factor [Candidatus Eisenbacteria bacterium]